MAESGGTEYGKERRYRNGRAVTNFLRRRFFDC
jgi:hypothetical protein